jgi:hypothetical protein
LQNNQAQMKLNQGPQLRKPPPPPSGNSNAANVNSSFNPEAVSNLLMGNQSAAGTRKRPHPGDSEDNRPGPAAEQQGGTDVDDDYYD